MLKHKIKPYIAQNCEICLYAYIICKMVTRAELKKKHKLETIIITLDLLMLNLSVNMDAEIIRANVA